MDVMLHGPLGAPTGFSLINRRLVAGLRTRGHRVTEMPTDAGAGFTDHERRSRQTVSSTGEPRRAPRATPPDVYLFHDWPFDFAHAVGRANAFFLEWEYRRLPAAWVRALDRSFDLVVVPSRAAGRVCRESGLRAPIHVCPGGVDTSEFHPARRPVALPTRKRFRFIHLGGAHERRGTDVLLRAYGAEFTADDDVCLVLKGFHYERHRPWLEREMRRAGLARTDAPEILYRHAYLPSVAPYFAAADVGVFPMRAECLGLPVLECIASGRPVIVPRGTGLDQFCNARNARFVAAAPVERRGRAALEPDVAHLRKLMRAAYERGPLSDDEQRAVAATVAGKTWGASLDGLSRALAAALARATRRSGAAATPARVRAGSAGAIVGRAGSCLTAFRDAADAGLPLRLRHGASAPLAGAIAAATRLRRAAGMPPPRVTPVARWQDAAELALATDVAVTSRAAARAFARAGFAATHVHVVPPTPPVRLRAPAPRGRARYLFAADDPFVAGLLLLLDAWERAALADAELVLACDALVWRSHRVLRWLVAHPAVRVVAPSRAGLRREVAAAHYVVVPSDETDVALEALARGRPLVAASGTTAAALLTPPRDGWTFRAGSAAALAAALRDSHAALRDHAATARHAWQAARRFRSADGLRALARALEARSR